MSKSKGSQVAPEMLQSPAVPSKVPAPSSLLKPLKDYAKLDAETQLAAYGTRLVFLTKIVMEYKHDLDALKQYPNLLRAALAEKLGIDLSKPQKQWPYGMAAEWGKLSQSILIPVNRLWGGIELDGTAKVLAVLNGKGTLQQKVAKMPRISTKGRKAKAPAHRQPVAAPLVANTTITGLPQGTITSKPEPVTIRATLAGIESATEDFLPTLIIGLSNRLAASNVPEWQMLARELKAKLEQYDARTGESSKPAVETKPAAEQKKQAA
jgi:hypothetical protein